MSVGVVGVDWLEERVQAILFSLLVGESESIAFLFCEGT